MKVIQKNGIVKIRDSYEEASLLFHFLVNGTIKQLTETLVKEGNSKEDVIAKVKMILDQYWEGFEGNKKGIPEDALLVNEETLERRVDYLLECRSKDLENVHYT